MSRGSPAGFAGCWVDRKSWCGRGARLHTREAQGANAMTDQSRLRRALLLADLVPGKPSDPASPGWGGVEADQLTEALLAHRDPQVRLAIAVANLLLREASRGALQGLDEQVHPIARARPAPESPPDNPNETTYPPDTEIGAIHVITESTTGYMHGAPTREAKYMGDGRWDVGVGCFTLWHTLQGAVRLWRRAHPAPASPPSGEEPDIEGAAMLIEGMRRATEVRTERDTLRARVEELERWAERRNEIWNVRYKQLEDERDTLRTEVNRLNTELFELKRQQPYRDEKQRELGRRERDGEVAELVKKLKGWDVVSDA